MSHDKTLHNAFSARSYLFVRVTPGGFHIHADQADESAAASLTGQVRKHHLVRKRFEDAVLVCDSKDGRRSRQGNACQECRHPLCRPSIRIHLVPPFTSRVVYILDLAVTSSQNFLRIAAEIEAEHKSLADVTLKLSVYNQGHWGEVRFERAT